MSVSSVIVLLLLVRSSLGQSGDYSDRQDDEDTEKETRTSENFACYSKLRMYKSEFVCLVTQRPHGTGAVYFNICKGSECEKHKENESLKTDVTIESYKVCVIGASNQSCRKYNVIKSAMPDPPALSVSYDNRSELYIFDIVAPYTRNEYLHNNLIHEVALHKEGTDWPVCENERTGHGEQKRCFQNNILHIPKRNVEPSTKYEAKVRSKPDERYFGGPWSHWSETVKFETEPNLSHIHFGDFIEPTLSGDFLVVILCCCAVAVVFILVIVLTKLFWKDRIKPLVWPEVPDHKNALEKLCISPKMYIQISFNPDFFDNYNINILDYMKAQVRTEDSFQVSSTDSQLEKQLDNNGCNNTSSPAEGSKESSALLSDIGDCSEPSSHLAANGTHEIDSSEKPENPENVIVPPSGCSSKCILSNDGSATGTDNFPAYSCAVKQPNNGLRGLCWEDISMYIAMSAFKTPNSSIKQSLNV